MSSVGIGRRELLRRLSLAGISAAASPAWARAFASLASADETPVSTASGWKPAVLTAEQDRTVTAIAEAIIPATDTPGAAAAFVNRYVDAVLLDADQADRYEFLRGLTWVDRRSRALFGRGFADATREQQDALLTLMSARDDHESADEVGRDFFEDMKVKTIVGYYTSEVGINEELKDGGPLMFVGVPACTHAEHGAPPPPPPARPGKRG
jgi:Gluconate 2-dehydrogenase subunit 3